MKTRIITVIAIILLIGIGVGAYIIYPRSKPVPVKMDSYLLDMTDTFRIVPERTDLIPVFSWSEEKQGRKTRLRAVTDVDYGDIYVFDLKPYKIPGQPKTWDFANNEIFRKEEIEDFESGVWDTIERLYADSIGYSNTSLLIPLVEELGVLQEYKNNDRSLVIYSDLGENRKELSFLKEDVITLLQKDSLSVWESILGVENLQDLSGITVYFIHRPMSGAEAEHYRIISGYLKRRLESYGAKVIIQGKVIHQSK